MALVPASRVSQQVGVCVPRLHAHSNSRLRHRLIALTLAKSAVEAEGRGGLCGVGRSDLEPVQQRWPQRLGPVPCDNLSGP